MAHQHALLEAFPIQTFGSGEATHVLEVPFIVHNGGFSIDDIGKFLGMKRLNHLLQGVVFMQLVACIQEAEVVARSQMDALVHGIVQAFVRFTHYLADMFPVSVGNIQGVVFRTSVYQYVFHMPIGLGNNALDSVFQYVSGIVGHRDDGELGMRMDGVTHSLRLSCYRHRCIFW